MSAELIGAINAIRSTNVTSTVHSKAYDAISPTRSELSQAGKTVLITGGGTAVGLGIANSFVHASASTVIIVGRRAEVLEQAKIQLEAVAKAAGTGTKIIARACDIVKASDVDALWAYFGEQNITVDVFVSNAAMIPETKTLMQLGFDEVWGAFDTNVKAPMYFADRFYKQGGSNKKYIINISSAVIHSLKHPLVLNRPAYLLTKAASTLYFQLMAQDQPREELQIVTLHPGAVFNDIWASAGLKEEHLDDAKLVGGSAVWAASEEAAFLHGRFAWSSWDVEELASGELRKRLDEDYNFLRSTIGGLEEGRLI